VANNKDANQKQPGEKEPGKYHYNPGNMSGKTIDSGEDEYDGEPTLTGSATARNGCEATTVHEKGLNRPPLGRRADQSQPFHRSTFFGRIMRGSVSTGSALVSILHSSRARRRWVRIMC
jgi:hypothetical protein